MCIRDRYQRRVRESWMSRWDVLVAVFVTSVLRTTVAGGLEVTGYMAMSYSTGPATNCLSAFLDSTGTPFRNSTAGMQSVVLAGSFAVDGGARPVSYTHLRAHETPEHLVCRLLLEKKKNKENHQK
eukprot:TRINITY_DN51845_c0_g1_i1.p1 TRINITY_DN51845_c0_g1~~TRINITY_DN51845_c0_g1_i1.p1  ORF type:complete len:126 (+),score=31.65 TRINITY_DN51845_c0_g1_i1:108-485(+)